MEPANAIATIFAAGAATVAGDGVSSAVKDAYTALKDLIRTRYPKIGIGQLEEAPASTPRRAVVEEDLNNTGASTDTEVLAAARQLAQVLVTGLAPSVAASVGVDLSELGAANVRLREVYATGSAGVSEAAVGGSVQGSVDIRSIQVGVGISGSGNIVVHGRPAGVEPPAPWPQAGKPRT